MEVVVQISKIIFTEEVKKYLKLKKKSKIGNLRKSNVI